jgi:pyruvate,water dikinase
VDNGMAQSPFLYTIGTGKLQKHGVCAKGVLLDLAARRGIAVPPSTVLFDAAVLYAEAHDMMATHNTALVPRDMHAFIDTFQLFHALTHLGSKIAVRTLFDTHAGAPLQMHAPGATRLRIDRRDPTVLATAVCAVWASARRFPRVQRRDVLLMTMVDAQHAGIAVIDSDFEDDFINYHPGTAEQLASGQSDTLHLLLPRLSPGETVNAPLPFTQRLQLLLQKIRIVFGDSRWVVEWADDGRECWLIELRHVVAPVRRNERFGSADIRDHMPELPSYFSAALYASISREVFGLFTRSDTRLSHERSFIEVFAGRVRVNYGLLADISRRWGVPGTLLADLNDALLVSIPTNPDRLRRSWWRLVFLIWEALTAPRRMRQTLAALLERTRKHHGDLDDLITVLQQAAIISVQGYFVTARIIGPLESWMRRRRVYAEWSVRYKSFQRTILADIIPIQQFVDTRPELLDDIRAARMPSDPVFVGKWEELMARYGHRGTAEYDIATPRYREHHEPILRRLIAHSTAIPTARHTLRGIAAWPVWVVLQYAMRRRDAIRSDYLRILERTRKVILQYAERIVAAGDLPSQEVVWMVSPAELVRISHGWRMPVEMLEARLALRAYYSQLDVPAALQRFDDPMRWREDGAPLRVVLEGRSINDGSVVGVTWRPTYNAATLPPGFDRVDVILVLRTFDAQWIAIAQHCAGIIVELGAELSHPATILRTLGIPTIMAVRSAYDSLPTGTEVTLMAGSGYVEVAQKSPLGLLPDAQHVQLPDFGATQGLVLSEITARFRR